MPKPKLKPHEVPLSDAHQAIIERRKRADALARMDDAQQLAALARHEFSFDEWCQFARTFPDRCARLHGEFCFIAVTTPEYADR